MLNTYKGFYSMVLIFDFLSFLLINYLALNFLSKRYQHYGKYLLFVCAYILICLLNLNGVNMFKAIGLLIIYIAYLLIQYKGNFLSYCFLIIPFFSFQIFSETLVAFLLTNVLIIHPTDDIFSFSYILGLLISFILLSIFTYIYTKTSKYIKVNNLPLYTWLIFVVPLILLFFVILEANYFNSFKYFPQQYGIIVILCILSYILTSIIFIMIINFNKNETNLKIEKYKTESLELKYKLISQHYLYNFNFLHNLIHSYSYLYKLINEKNYDHAKIKIQELMDDTYKEFNMIYSNSIVLNYLINLHLQNFKNNNIDCIAIIEDEKINTINFDTQFEFFNYILDISETQINPQNDKHSIILIKSKTIANKLAIQCIFPYQNLNLNNLKKQIADILSQYQCLIGIDVENNKKIKLLVCFLDVT